MKKIILWIFLFIIVASAGFLIWLPSPKEMKGCLVTRMYEVKLCPGSKDYVPLSRISNRVYKAILLTEDANFYNHNGFEWDAIEKNALEGFAKGTFKKGGSTITQQLAKNMYLWKDRSFVRKGLEAIITYRLESYLTKNEILERYLNVIEYGEKVYGIKAAAQYYFKKQPHQLDATEGAFLAMLLPNPKKYSRSYFKKELSPFAKKRVAHILKLMLATHKIDANEYDFAKSRLNSFFKPLSLEEIFDQMPQTAQPAQTLPLDDNDDLEDFRD